MNEKKIAEMANDIEVIGNGSGHIDFYRTAEILHSKGYRKASEVAKEIFAEIEEIFNKRIAFYTDMAKQSKFTEKHYAETMIKNCEIYIQEIAELKKKYTEDGE